MPNIIKPQEDSVSGEGAGLLSCESEKFLTFSLDGKEYGIEILKVKEIMGVMPITPIPQSSLALKGIVDLRGKAIPVFDLRLIFGMQEKEYGHETCMVILEVGGGLSGIVVDTVSEVIDINSEEVELTSEIEINVDSRFILGISRSHGRITMLIDIECVLRSHSGPINGG